MSTDYEHEGVVYHEPLPRVLLANFSNSLTHLLRERSHNVTTCEVANFEGDRFRILNSPRASYEVDVLLVRDYRAPSQSTDIQALAHSLRVPLGPDHGPSFHSALTVPGGGLQSLDSFYGTVVSRKGVCVFFLSERAAELFRGFKYSRLPSRTLIPGQNAYRLVDTTGWEPLKQFIERTFRQATVCIGLHRSGSIDGTFAHVLVDPTDCPYAVGIATGPPTRRDVGRVLILPDYGENVEVLDLLLSEVLPDLSPHLFPFRHDLAWLKERDFRHPTVPTLEQQKVKVQSEAAEQVADLDRQIDALDESERFLQEMLTTDGDVLKAAVKACLDALFRAAGVADAEVVDVDPDPADRGGERPRREDLRVEWAAHVTLINVSGREKFFRQTSINQVAEHERRYLSATKLPVTQVHSLLIANFNYGEGIDPRKRGDIFGSGTAEARERLVSSGYGALGTYDLYRVFRAAQIRRIAVSPEALKDLLATEGIFDYSAFAGVHAA
jgi:hypothetical protein